MRHDPQHEQGVGDEVAPPKALRLPQQTRQPLQPQALEDGMGALDPPRVEVEDGADGADETDVELPQMLVDPFLLLGSGHADPEDVRAGGVDGLKHPATVCFVEFGLEGRRIGAGQVDIGEVPSQAPFDLPQGLLARPQEEVAVPSPSSVQPAAEAEEDIAAGHPLPDPAAENPGAVQDADAVGGQQVGAQERLAEGGVACGDHQRVGVRAGEEPAAIAPLQPAGNLIQAAVDGFGGNRIAENIFLLHPPCPSVSFLRRFSMAAR